MCFTGSEFNERLPIDTIAASQSRPRVNPIYFRIEYDNDFDGSSDATYYYRDGIRQRVDWHPGNSSSIARRETFMHGVKWKEYIDSNRDGKFDLKLRYDAMEKEIGRTPYTP